MTKEETVARALLLFDEGYACSQAVLIAFADQYQLDETTAKRIASTFGGGMGRLREKCGALTGGFMVLGLEYGNTIPGDIDTKLAAYEKVRALNSQFEKIHGTTMCADILQTHATETQIAERAHHQIICRKVVGDAASLIFDMINAET